MASSKPIRKEIKYVGIDFGYNTYFNLTDLNDREITIINNFIKLKEKCIRENLEITPFSYENAHQKIEIKCLKHNYTWKTQIHHLTREDKQTGCKLCSKERASQSCKYTQEEIEDILKCREQELNITIPNFIYDNIYQKIDIVCNVCKHEWSPTICSLKRGSGCPQCAKERRKLNNRDFALDEVIEKLDKYSKELDFTLLETPKNSTKSTKFKCKCNKCGDETYRTIDSFLKQRKCKRCYVKNKLTQEEAEQKIYDLNKYSFEPFIYKNNRTKIIVTCLDCGNTRESEYSNLFRRECPHCSANLYSKIEKEILEFCKDYTKSDILENDRKTIKNPYTNYCLELDILIPDLNLAIEFNGSYWHSNKKIRERYNGLFKKAKDFHKLKTKLCKEKNIKLIHIFETHYYNNKNYYLEKIKNELVRGNSN